MATGVSYSACQGFNFASNLFFIRATDGAIAYCTCSAQGIETKDTTYAADVVRILDEPVYPSTPRLSAVAWARSGVEEIRVYYIKNGPSGPQLRELCRTGGGEWYTTNKLDSKRLLTARDSQLAAIEEGPINIVKVYFQRPGGKAAVCWSSWPGTQAADTYGVEWKDQDLQAPVPVSPSPML